MDRLSDPSRWVALVGAGPAQEPCVAAVRAFAQGVRGEFGGLSGVERAFAWEGVGFASRLRGLAPPLSDDPHLSMFIGVGAGIALAAGVGGTPLSLEEAEGLGFGVGLLRTQPARLRVDSDAFAHGLGRSLWFSRGGSVAKIGQALRSFPDESRAQIARGVGFAAAFASRLGVDALAASLPGDCALAARAGHADGLRLRSLLDGR